MRVRRQGMSLLELVLTFALILLVLGLAYQIVLPSLRIWVTNQSQSAVEETGLVLENRLVKELERSDQATVTILPTPGPLQGFSFASFGNETQTDIGDPWNACPPPPDGYNPQTGQAEWQYYVVYFLPHGSQNLYRKIWPVPPTSNAQNPPFGPQGAPFGVIFPAPVARPLTNFELNALCTTINGSERQVSSNVDTIQLSLVPPDLVSGRQITTSTDVSLNLLLSAPAPVPGNLVHTQRSQNIEMRM